MALKGKVGEEGMAYQSDAVSVTEVTRGTWK